MRNTKYFDINVYDEQEDLADEDFHAQLESNPFFKRTLSEEQRQFFQSKKLRKLALAKQKWEAISKLHSDQLDELFKNFGAIEFDKEKAGYEFHPFKAGKFWQMFDYLDGNLMLGQEQPETIREEWQNKLIMQEYFGSRNGADLLQIGFDLAINSALLCDLMPNPRNTGSVYLFENVVQDRNSLLYPAVTEEFQTRVVNEAFWESLYDFNQRRHLPVLETILTDHHEKLDPRLMQENLLRRGVLFSNPLVLGDSGPESFTGLSRRAIKNHGEFLKKAAPPHFSEHSPFNIIFKEYINAVVCTDSDGFPYFSKDERKEILDSPIVISYQENMAQKY